MKRTIMHIDYKLPSFVLLCSGICFGELIGIIIAILDRDLLGIVEQQREAAFGGSPDAAPP